MQAVGTNTFFVAKWIVSPDPTQGTQTTIAAASAAASAGDTIYILNGTYTENVTFTAGVNYVALINSAGASPTGSVLSTVTINGNQTFSTAGQYNVTGIYFTATSGNPITVSGSAQVNVVFQECYIYTASATGTGISFTNSNSASSVSVLYCEMDLVSGASYYTMSSPGNLFLSKSDCLNSGGSIAASSNSAGTVTVQFMSILTGLSTSSSGVVNLNFVAISSLAQNVISLTLAGTGSSTASFTNLSSGSASALSIGSGTTLTLSNARLLSTSASAIVNNGTMNYGSTTFVSSYAITGTGTSTPLQFGPTLYVSGISFDSGSDIMATYIRQGTYTPTLTGSTTAGTTTYTLQFGAYTQIGSRIYLDVQISYSAVTGTGNAQVSIPLTASGATNSLYNGPCAFTRITLTGSPYFASIATGATVMLFTSYRSGNTQQILAIANPSTSPGIIQASISYLTT